MTLSRRTFLGIAGGATAVAAGGIWAGLVRDHVDQATGASPTTSTSSGVTTTVAAPEASGRVLVVVQCNGGNDALNSLVPAANGHYYDLRPSLGVPADEVVPLAGADGVGLHPALGALAPAWDAGHLAAVQGVGFDGQSRSHFAAMDLWFSATPGEALRAGWLGRWLDATGDPSNPLRAIALGGPCPALVGEQSLPTQVNDPRTFSLRAPPGSSPEQIADAFLATASPMTASGALADAQAAVPAALEAVDLLAVAGDEPTAEPPDGDDRLTTEALLQTAAGIIGLDVGAEVIVVVAGGFDTHAAQAATHEALLSDVAQGISSFFTTLEGQGLADDVIVMTTSEFGRRVAENASGGTDHGNAGTHFLSGPAVRGAVVGETDLAHLVDGDLPIGVDSRSLYAVGLDWLGDEATTDEVLGGSFDRYDLIPT